MGVLNSLTLLSWSAQPHRPVSRSESAWADPGLHQALRAVAVPDQTLAPVHKPLALHRRRERFGFRLDGLGQ